MLWAARCLGFFGFLRVGKFTLNTSDPPLTPCDVAVDSRTNPQTLKIHLRHSKADLFGVGCHDYLGRTNITPCLVSVMLNYLSLRPPVDRPLFLFQNGTPLTRVALVAHLRTALTQAGVDSTHYAGHSFCIGAATAAAQAGYSDSFIQSLGRWKSQAFVSYIRASLADLIA